MAYIQPQLPLIGKITALGRPLEAQAEALCGGGCPEASAAASLAVTSRRGPGCRPVPCCRNAKQAMARTVPVLPVGITGSATGDPAHALFPARGRGTEHLDDRHDAGTELLVEGLEQVVAE